MQVADCMRELFTIEGLPIKIYKCYVLRVRPLCFRTLAIIDSVIHDIVVLLWRVISLVCCLTWNPLPNDSNSDWSTVVGI